MADIWDQFPDHPAAATTQTASDPWAQFPDHPATGLQIPSASGPVALTPEQSQKYQQDVQQTPAFVPANTQNPIDNAVASAINAAGSAAPNFYRGLHLIAGATGFESKQEAGQSLFNPYQLASNPDSISGMVGGAVGSIPAAINPVIAGTIGATNKLGEIEREKALQGKDIGLGSEIANVAGTGVLDAALSKVFGGKAPGQLGEKLAAKLAPMLSGVVAKYGARAAVDALAAEGSGFLEDELNKATTNPEQATFANVTGKRALLGGVTGLGVGLAHDVLNTASPESPISANAETAQNVGTSEQVPTAEAPKHTFPDTNLAPDDVTTLRKQLREEKLARRTDELTGAPNKIQYQEDAGKIFQDADAKNEHTAIVETDIGGLKVMNTVYGHEGGDAMLKLAHDAMREELRTPEQKHRPEDYLGSSAYRVGGDEFPAILRGIKTPEQAKAAMDRVNANFDAKIAKQFPDLPPEARPFIAYNAEIRKPGDVRTIEQLRAAADAGVEPAKTAIKATRNIPEGRTDLLNYIKEKTGKTTETLAEKPSIFQSIKQAGDSAIAQKAKEALTSEEGGTRAFQTFAERKVIPKANKVFGQAAETWKNVNRFLGTGLSDTAGETQVKGRVREMTGDLDRQGAQTEERFRDARASARQMNPKDQVELVDAITHGVHDTHPLTQSPVMKQAVSDLEQINTQNRKDAMAVGLSGADDWDTDYIGRLFEFPDKGPGGKASLAGAEGFRKAQKYDTYAEALAAVEKQGGKPKFENPIDMMLAKQAEIRKSIEARKLVKEQLNAGNVVAIKPHQSLPDGHVFLDDRLSRGFPVDQIKGGQPTGETVNARLAAPEAIANTLNQIIGSGLKSKLPIVNSIIGMKRATAALNFSLSAWHVPIETIRNAGAQVGLALDNLFHGEVGLAGRNIKRALPWTQANFGGTIRKAAAEIGQTGPLEPVISAVSKSGAKLSGRSMLNPGSWEKMVDNYKAGDPISAGAHLIHGIGDTITGPIMERFVPNIKAGYLSSLAETYLSRGMKGEELARAMRLGADNADNVLGQVVRSNQFQHRVVQDLIDVVFSAPKFAEGDIRSAGSFARDTAKGIRDMVQGKKPTLTPAMQTFLGHAVTQATLGAAIQTAYQYATTGKVTFPTSVKDFFMPKTGRKNPDGTDERIMLPTGFSLFTSLATEGPKKTVANRIAPIWRAMVDVAQNADYRNVQVRDPNASYIKQVGQVAGHVGKSLLPFSVASMVEKPSGQEQTTDLKVGGFLGVRKASARLSQSPAEQLAHDFAYGNIPQAARSKEAADKYSAKQQIEAAIRSRDPDAGSKIAEAIKSGTLTRPEIADARRRAQDRIDLQGLIQHGSFTSEQVMQIWDKATPDERRLIRFRIRAKVGRDTNLTTEQRNEYKKKLAE